MMVFVNVLLTLLLLNLSIESSSLEFKCPEYCKCSLKGNPISVVCITSGLTEIPISNLPDNIQVSIDICMSLAIPLLLTN